MELNDSSDLSEISASLNAERMDATLRQSKGLKVSKQPARMMPTSARATIVYDSSEATEQSQAQPEQPKPHVRPQPMTGQARAQHILNENEKIGALYSYLTDSERKRMRLSLAPPNSFSYAHSSPSQCVMGGTIVAALIGFCIGMMVASKKSSNASHTYRAAEKSNATGRVVDKVLKYA